MKTIEVKTLRVCGLLAAAKTALENLKTLTDGETCDHAVNICWCGIFADMEDLKDNIEAMDAELPKEIV